MKRFIIASLAAVAASANAQLLYNNGPLSTGPTTESGVAAPAGTTWSEVQHDAGNTTESNTVAGYSCFRNAGATSVFHLADDFTVTGPAWQINSVDLWAYRTGQAVGTSPFGAAFLQIWNGRPGDAGASVVYGDLTTNVLATSTFDNMYRCFNTVVPPPGTVQGTTRGIFKNSLTTNVALATGTYWMEWTYTMTTDTFTSFTPSVTVVGSRGLAGWNARQRLTAGTWQDAIDAGNPATAPDVPQDIVFQVNGTVVPEPGTFVALGFGLAALAALRRRK